MRPNRLLSVIFLLAAALCLARFSLAADRADVLFYDFPAIEKLTSHGLQPPSNGIYQVWIWGKGPELSITIGQKQFKVRANRFGWYHAGELEMRGDETVPVRIERLEDLSNVPGYLALSSDTQFDPKRAPLAYLRTLNDGGRFQPRSSQGEWLERTEALRRQILVSSGLWPMPPRGPLGAQIYGKQLRDGYTIEKVVLETFPGFYLSGNLYRPAPWVQTQQDSDDVQARKRVWQTNRQTAKRPGILCPHGHWRQGRFEPEVQRRCKQLARMGAVVFSYDMVGRGDSAPFGHSFLDPEIELIGFSLMGLQTWNSIRALDFLCSLPDVDRDRIACTGASGGGTQTFLLAAVDDRVKVAAPVVMVSQSMQGGCSCENASGLRIGTDNSEFAALFAPQPQLLVGAHDWTWEFMSKGFPEIKATYRLFGAEDRVEAEVFDFPHNYNQTSRERVYRFLAKWLYQIDPALSRELPSEPEAPETITTWDAQHPRPEAAIDPNGLKRYLAALAIEQAKQWEPRTPEQWAETRRQLATALGIRLALDLPGLSDGVIELTESTNGPADFQRVSLRLGSDPSPRVTAVQYLPATNRPKAATLLVHPAGTQAVMANDMQARSLVGKLVDHGHLVLAIDLYPGTNPFLRLTPREISHFDCYNRTVAAERLRDIVTAIVYLRRRVGDRPVNLVGLGAAGPLCLLARTQTPAVARTVIDADQFEYRVDSQVNVDRLLPGIIRLGGLRALSCLAAPGRLWIHNTAGALDTSWLEAAYELSDAAEKLTVHQDQASPEQILAELVE